MSTLYMVATPIGNLKDITYRAIEVLKSVDALYCEDTRRSKILLDTYEIDVPRFSLHARTGPEKIAAIANKIANGLTAAYVSDAGTPCISDPGFRLVRACLGLDITIVPVPGPNALATALSVAGVPTSPLTWHGFLPHKKGRQTLLAKITEETKMTHVMYESVHRMDKLLGQLLLLCPDRWIVIGRELTKMHEEVFRGTVQQAHDHFSETGLRGEFVVLLSPSDFRP